jgi:hypothetical protein
MAYGASATFYNQGNCSGEVLTIPDDALDSIYFWDAYKQGDRWPGTA